MLYDTIFNYSHPCHCLHSFKFLQQSTAWILLLNVSYWQRYLSLKSLLFILTIYIYQPMQSIGADRHLPFAICWQHRKMVPYVWQCSFRVWRRTQLFNDGSYHLVLVRTVSFPFSSQPPQTLHGPAFLPCCPHGYHLPWVGCPGICPSVPASPSTLTFLLPPPIPTMSPLFFFSLQVLEPLTLSLFLHE